MASSWLTVSFMVQSQSVTDNFSKSITFLYASQFACFFKDISSIDRLVIIFEFVYNNCHIYKKWVLSLDSKCQKHCYIYWIDIFFIPESVS